MKEATTTTDRGLTLFYPKNDKTGDESRDIKISIMSTTTEPVSTATRPPATTIEVKKLRTQASTIGVGEFSENKVDLSTDIKPKEFERCENISSGWSCSSGNNRHSVCIRQCQKNAHSESIKCKCKNHSCRWEQKGKSCTSYLNQGLGGWNNLSSQTGQFLMNPIIGQSVSGDSFLNNSDNNQQNKKPEIINFNQTGGRIPEKLSGTRSIEFGRSPDESSFAQLFRDLKLSNTGHMVFNVNYNFNNYPSAL